MLDLGKIQYLNVTELRKPNLWSRTKKDAIRKMIIRIITKTP